MGHETRQNGADGAWHETDNDKPYNNLEELVESYELIITR